MNKDLEVKCDGRVESGHILPNYMNQNHISTLLHRTAYFLHDKIITLSCGRLGLL